MDLTDFLYREATSILCGDFLGEGSARKVYALRTNPEYVVKVEERGGSFQNVAEWDIWSWVKAGPMQKWFAPCEMISTCGVILVQRKVDSMRLSDRPLRLPQFLCDLKPENFGVFEGRIVCCDYGTVGSAIRTVPRNMVRAEWR